MATIYFVYGYNKYIISSMSTCTHCFVLRNTFLVLLNTFSDVSRDFRPIGETDISRGFEGGGGGAHAYL